MKKYSLFFSLLFLLTINLSAFSAITLEEPFDEIRVTGKIRVILEAADTESVEVKMDDDKVSVEVKAGVLHLKRKEMWKYKSYKKTIEVVVQYKKLRGISADAGSEVQSNSVLVSADALELSFGSGASADLEVQLEDLKVSVGEGANLKLEGTTTELNAKASTGGILNAFFLQSERVYVKANTGGQAEVKATEVLEASANTGGMIDYRGNPERLNTSNSLGGQIDSRGM